MSQVIRKLQEGGSITPTSKKVKVDGRDVDVSVFIKNLDYNVPNMVTSEDDKAQIEKIKSALLNRDESTALKFENNTLIDPLNEFNIDSLQDPKAKESLLNASKLIYQGLQQQKDPEKEAVVPKKEFNLDFEKRINDKIFGGQEFSPTA